jgi:murein tripeptide amidase MpaA
MSSQPTSPTTHRRVWWRALPILALLAALLPLSATTASAQVETDAYCRSNVRTKIDLFLTYGEMRARLNQIEARSNGRVEVGVAGQSFHGRTIPVARVGNGDQTIFIQSEIHGNEKHGTIALLDVIERIAADNPRAAQIRDEITLFAIPMLNADGAELDQRRNDMSWADTVGLHPQLEGAPPAWYHSSGLNGFDVNRDFHPDLDYVPDPDDLPGTGSQFGFYLTPSAWASRDVYRDIEDEFGSVDVFVDLHNQAACYRWGNQSQVEDPRLSYFSISSEIVSQNRAADWPDLDLDASRRVNLAVYDALQTSEGAQHPLSRITRYPVVDLPGTALGSYSLRGSAVVLFETSGQTQHIGHHRINLLVNQVDRGMMGIIDEMTDGTLDDKDPDRFFDIPSRAGWSF